MKLRYPVEYSRQEQQFLDSYCRVMGHEPTAAEIAAFEERHRLTPRLNAPGVAGVPASLPLSDADTPSLSTAES